MSDNMDLPIDEKLRRHFALASLRMHAEKLKTPEAWQRAQRIMERGKLLRTRAEEAYENRRGWKVDRERRRLIDEAGRFQRSPRPTFAAADRFDPERTRQLAEKAVRARHDARLARINLAESRTLARLMREVVSRTPDRLRETFTKYARDGPTRGRRRDRA